MTNASPPELLFVYGTLRPQLVHLVSSPGVRQLVDRLTRLGQATIEGRIHDLGTFPALVLPAEPLAVTEGSSGPPHLVIGDLLRVDGEALAALDMYEECTGPSPLYRREQVDAVRQDDGRTVRAWTYVFCRDLGAAPRIEGGDYAWYLSDVR